jgi:PAS domain S-box-containing protein
MRLSIDQKAVTGFGLWFVVVGTLCLASYYHFAQAQESQWEILRSSETEKDLHILQSDVLEAERAELHFLVTSDQNDLLPFRRAAGRIGPDARLVRDASEDSALQQQRLASLDFLLARKVADLEQAITARTSRGPAVASTLVAVEKMAESGPGADQLLREMESEQSAIALAQTRAASSAARSAFWLIIAGVALSFLGVPLAAMVVRCELTEIHRAKDEKDRAESFLESVFENIPSMIFIKDARTLKFVRVNRACEEAIGFTRAEMIGRSTHDLFPEEEASFLTAKDLEVLESGELLDVPEESILTKNKGVRILHARKIPLFDSNGAPQFLLGISEDITEIKEARQALVQAKEVAERSNKFKDQFLSTMSHELRTPLNAVVGFSELLTDQQYGPLNERQHRYVNHIRTGGKHLLSLINDILDLSKIEAGRLQLTIGIVPVSLWFAEVVDSLQSLATKKSQTLVVDASSTLSVHADSTRFKQILTNLIGNAIKFTPEEGKITVAARRDGDQVRIEVRDSGPGIPLEQQHRVFEAFVRLTDSDKSVEGTGLGLAITSRLVELHGGKLGIESAPGEGSCFYFFLPAAAIHLTQEKPNVNAPFRNGEGRTILIVEDDPVAAQLIQSQLASSGYDVVVCDHPQIAVEMAAELQPCAITLDIVMKPMNGWQVLPNLKSDPRTVMIPVIVVSIVDQPGMGALLGADEYIVKPVQKPALLAAVQRCLDRRGPDKSKGTENILVVEDDAPTREFIAELLSKRGYSVCTAADGTDALAHVTSSPPQLIILDLILPGLSGFELLTEWRSGAQTADIPVFVLTNKDLTPTESDYLQRNTYALFRKQESWGDSLLRQLQRVAAPAHSVGAK